MLLSDRKLMKVHLHKIEFAAFKMSLIISGKLQESTSTKLLK